MQEIVSSTYRNIFWLAIGLIIYAIFSVGFVRIVGIKQYADFVFLASTLSALLLIGSYQSYLVSYNAVKSVKKFRQFIPLSLVINIASAALAAVMFTIVMKGDFWVGIIAFVVAIILFARNTPSGVLLATKANWLVSKYRTIYQSSVIILFCLTFFVTDSVIMSFGLATLISGLIHLKVLYNTAISFLSNRSKKTTNFCYSGIAILVIAIVSNSAVSLSLLVDKFAISYTSVGKDSLGVPLYLLYYDVLSKVALLYNVALGPLTFFLLTAFEGSPEQKLEARRLVLKACILIIFIGAIITAASVTLIPWVYGISIEDDMIGLPILMAIWITFNGFGYIALAVCNAVGFNKALLIQNIASLLLLILGVAVFHFTLGIKFSIYHLVALMIFSQGVQIVTLVVAMRRFFGKWLFNSERQA